MGEEAIIIASRAEGAQGDLSHAERTSVPGDDGAKVDARRLGVGSFVRGAVPAPRERGGSVMDELRQTQFETEVEVLEFGIRPAPQRRRTDAQ